MTEFSIDEILDKRTPAERSVLVMLDGTLSEAIIAKRREVASARVVDDGTLSSPVARLEKELAEMQAEAEVSKQKLTFRPIPRPEYEALIEASPPTDEQADEGYIFDPDVFGPRIIAASSHSPEINEDAAQRIWNEWSAGDVDAVFAAAYGINKEARVRPFVEGSRPTPGSGPNSITASPPESPTPSS